jgi:hypothetical protein
MGDLVQIRAHVADVLRGFISIGSKERPDSCESVNLSIGNEPGSKEQHTFATGDFIADWDRAIETFMTEAAERGYGSVSLMHSSSVDFWESDSCQFVPIEPTATDWAMRWRRATDAEERTLRQAYADVHAVSNA